MSEIHKVGDKLIINDYEYSWDGECWSRDVAFKEGDTIYPVDAVKDIPHSQKIVVQNPQELITALAQREADKMIKEKETLERLSYEHNLKSRGGGIVELPKITKPLVYDDIKSGITDLYKKSEKANTQTEREESKRIIDEFWDKVTKKQLKEVEFSMTGCPNCGWVMDADDLKCSKCGFDFRDYKRFRVWG